MHTNSKESSKFLNIKKNAKDKRAGLKVCQKDSCIFKNEEVPNGLFKVKKERYKHSSAHKVLYQHEKLSKG